MNLILFCFFFECSTSSLLLSTGIKNKIQVSEATANILIAKGKGHWVVLRTDAVHAKGKGILQTYWLDPQSSARSTTVSTTTDGNGSNDNYGDTAEDIQPCAKNARRIDWVCEILQHRIQMVLSAQNSSSSSSILAFHSRQGSIPIDEITEVLPFRPVDIGVMKQSTNNCSLELDDDVKNQLRQYVNAIAAMYHMNPFHNFEHAMHVTMSVNKLLSRTLSSDKRQQQSESKEGHDTESQEQERELMLRMGADPLALLAIVFAAFIHDVDHQGKRLFQRLTN